MSISITNGYTTNSILNALQKSTGEMNNSLERISTGRRINSAADDASGLIIADGLNSQARSMGQEIQNLNNDISRIQIGDSALGDATEIMQGIREKALQAASDSQTGETRAAIQTDVTGAVKALDDLYSTTTFGGQQILEGSPGLAALQGIDLGTREGAEQALETIDTALEEVQTARSDLGSRQNQAASQVNNLYNTYVATQSAESQIRDVDIAEEAMNLNRLKVMQKANILALAQSNVSRKSVMSLLG